MFINCDFDTMVRLTASTVKPAITQKQKYAGYRPALLELPYSDKSEVIGVIETSLHQRAPLVSSTYNREEEEDMSEPVDGFPSGSGERDRINASRKANGLPAMNTQGLAQAKRNLIARGYSL
jgi:hypothetical protein